jgi:hypothetical protein
MNLPPRPQVKRDRENQEGADDGRLNSSRGPSTAEEMHDFQDDRKHQENVNSRVET